MPNDDRAIAAHGLVKRYGDRSVVDRVSFEVNRGECLALLGPNGAGKTTTIEILEGYRAPDDGEVRVLGLDPILEASALKQRIGLMLQEGGIYQQIRPLEALRLFAAFYADPADPRELLRRVGLDDAIRTRYRNLSGGQKQRLALALALIGRPELVFLDEPTTGMDPRARHSTWDTIRDLKRIGVTVLLTTHFMEEAERLADRVGILNHGRLVALDSPRALAAAGRSDEIRFRAQPGLPLNGLADRLGAGRVAEPRPGEYVAAVEPSPARVAVLAGWLADRDVLVSSLRVSGESLEETYLRLTGATELDYLDE